MKRKRRLSQSKNENKTKKLHPMTIRTKVNVNKVKFLILKENLPTQKSIALRQECLLALQDYS